METVNVRREVLLIVWGSRLFIEVKWNNRLY